MLRDRNKHEKLIEAQFDFVTEFHVTALVIPPELHTSKTVITAVFLIDIKGPVKNFTNQHISVLLWPRDQTRNIPENT